MLKRFFAVVLSMIMILSMVNCVFGAEETNENLKFVFNCGDDTNNYKDLKQYKGITVTNVNTVYDSIEKTISVTASANYTFSLNLGKASAGNILCYIERVEGGEVSIAATGALSTIENRVLFTDVPLKADVSYRIIIFNMSSATLRIQDIVLEATGEYKADVKDLRIFAKHYNAGKANSTYQSAISVLPNNYLSYNLNPGAGNYKVSLRLKKYRGNPTHIDMSVNNQLVSRTNTTKVLGSFADYDFGYISVTDEQFTLKFTVPAKPSTASYGDIYFYYINLERIDSPEITVHSSNTPSATNVISNLQEGTITAKAYLPENVKDKPVTMIFAIYDDEELCKVEKTTVDNAIGNQVMTATVSDIVFEEGKNYTSKVFFLNDMVNIQAYYKLAPSGILTNVQSVTE